MTRLNTQFSAKGISLLNSVMHRPAQFSSKSFCSIKSTISLEMKCPQLSKPEATAARNQNSIGDRTEKKTLGETRLSQGASSPLARRTSSSIPTAAKSDCKGSTGSSGLFPMAVYVTESSLGICLWGSSRCPGLR